MFLLVVFILIVSASGTCNIKFSVNFKTLIVNCITFDKFKNILYVCIYDDFIYSILTYLYI